MIFLLKVYFCSWFQDNAIKVWKSFNIPQDWFYRWTKRMTPCKDECVGFSLQSPVTDNNTNGAVMNQQRRRFDESMWRPPRALCACCEIPVPRHSSLSCSSSVADDWLVAGFSLTHCLPLLCQKFPSFQPVNRQFLPGEAFPPSSPLIHFHSQSQISLWMGSDGCFQSLLCLKAAKEKQMKSLPFGLTEIRVDSLHASARVSGHRRRKTGF